MKIDIWREEVRKANPGIHEGTLDHLVEREIYRRKANRWMKRGLDERYIPYVRRERRMEAFMELGVSLAEGLPEFYELLVKAEDAYIAEHPDYTRRLPWRKD